MAMKLLMLVIFFAIMVSVGIYARKHATSVDGYVLGRKIGRPVAYGICVWNVIFLRSCIRRICRTVWMEIWSRIYMDRSWECDYRKFAGMGCTRKTYQGYDTAFEF